jgi:hypothetical protein
MSHQLPKAAPHKQCMRRGFSWSWKHEGNLEIKELRTVLYVPGVKSSAEYSWKAVAVLIKQARAAHASTTRPKLCLAIAVSVFSALLCLPCSDLRCGSQQVVRRRMFVLLPLCRVLPEKDHCLAGSQRRSSVSLAAVFWTTVSMDQRLKKKVEKRRPVERWFS